MDRLAIPLAGYEPGPPEFLHVVGYGREGHIKITCHLADGRPVVFVQPAPGAARPDELENSQPAFVRQGLHGGDDFLLLVKFTGFCFLSHITFCDMRNMQYKLLDISNNIEEISRRQSLFMVEI
jgi:hypothetical protein